MSSSRSPRSGSRITVSRTSGGMRRSNGCSASARMTSASRSSAASGVRSDRSTSVDVGGDEAADVLHGPHQVLTGEAGPQVVVAGQQRAERRAHRVDVELAVEVEDVLRQIGVDVVGVGGLVVDALLQRRQRPDVLHLDGTRVDEAGELVVGEAVPGGGLGRSGLGLGRRRR